MRHQCIRLSLVEPVEVFGPKKVFGEKMWNDKWPQQFCLFSISLCVYIIWSCSNHVINLHSDQHFTPGCWICKSSWLIFFFSSFTSSLAVAVWKNQLVIRFCAAVGYAVSFSLQAAVGVWNGAAGKGVGIHVRSTQPVPKLDHVSASTRSLQMEHKSPLTSWKMTGNQFCTIYGINAMEMSLLTKNRRLSLYGENLTLFYLLFF